MNGDKRENDCREERLNKVYMEYVQAITAGQDDAHAKEDLCKQYPDLAPDIEKFEYIPPVPRCPQCDGQLETPLAGGTTCASCGARFQRGPDLADPFPIPFMVGRIELREVIGRGSFGTVYRGWDPQIQRVVAVKALRMLPVANPNGVKRFLQDGQIEAQLDHHGIVKVYDVGQVQEVPYLISEFIPGGTLANLIRDERGVLRENRPGPKQAALYVAAIADALEHAHERGVVHRDVKPANILMKYGKTPLLTDFGLAHWDAGEITTTVEGKIIGTLAYMSPEQARGKKVDRRSDVYSVGVVLYELLTGARPFDGNVRRMLAQIEFDEPRSPRALDDRVPRDLETICLKCLEKAPSRRPRTAAEVVVQLGKYERGEPIDWRPVSRLGRLVRWSRRKPGLAASLGSVAILLIAIASVSAAWAIHSIGQKAKIQEALDDSKLIRAKTEFERGLAQADRGDVGMGMLGMARSLEIAPPTAKDLVKTIELNLAAWQNHLFTLTTCTDPPSGKVIGFARDGHAIWVTNPGSSEVRSWDMLKQQFDGPAMKHPGGISAFGMSADGKSIATGSQLGTIRLWDISTGQLNRELRVGGEIRGIAIFPDGRKLVAGVVSGTGEPETVFRTWDIADPTGLRVRVGAAP
jgi:serine/threonine protein kinase